MYSRSKKTHLNAIGYELEMLRFCRDQIQAQSSPPDARATSLHIEGFLLHFRNLIRFFSGKRPRPYDLSTADPDTWANNWPDHLANAYQKAGIIDQAADFVAARL